MALSSALLHGPTEGSRHKAHLVNRQGMLNPDIGPVESASSFAEVGYLRLSFRAGCSSLEYSHLLV